MGKKPIFDWNKKYNVLKKLEIFNKFGELKKEISPIWDEACKKFSPKVNRKSLYLDVFKNRGKVKNTGIRTALKNYAIKKGKFKPPHISTSKDESQSSEKQGNQASEIISSKKRKVHWLMDEDKSLAKKRKVEKDVIAASNKNGQVFENVDQNCSFGELENLAVIVDVSKHEKSSWISDCETESGTSNDECTDALDDSFQPKSPKDKNPLNLQPLEFSIHLDKDEWLKIKPQKGKLPKFKWAPIIRRKIFAATKLECSTGFRVSKVYSTTNDLKYIDFYGRCKEPHCRTYLYGVCDEKPRNDKNGITFHIYTYDTRNVVIHEEKLFFAHDERKSGKEILRYISASEYRQKLVNEYMNYSDPEPPFLPSLNVLRGARAEAIKENLGIHGPKHPVDALLFLMNELPFITEVCSHPFRCSYQSEDQIKLWNDSSAINLAVTIDATGSFVRKIDVGEEKSNDIFLYQLMTIIDHNYAPLCQMLSSRHDTNVVYAFLQEWLRRIDYLPKSVISDGSLVLLTSLCETFNDCSLSEYLVDCDDFLSNPGSAPLNFNCAIRMDRAHVTKNSTNWKCVKESKDQTVKDFYPRTIALACKSKNYEEIMSIFKATIIVCESKYMPPKSLCFQKYSYLIAKIQKFDDEELADVSIHDENEDSFSKLENTQEDVEKYIGDNDLKSRIHKLYEDTKKLAHAKDNVGIPNTLHLSDLKNSLIYLYSLYPLWTGAMVPHFEDIDDVATSGGNEAYFKDLRRYIKGLLGAPTFVLQHEQIISAQVKMAKARLKKLLIKNQDMKKDVEKDSVDLETLAPLFDKNAQSIDGMHESSIEPSHDIEKKNDNLMKIIENESNNSTEYTKEHNLIINNQTNVKIVSVSPEIQNLKTIQKKEERKCAGAHFKGVFHKLLQNGGKISIEDGEGNIINDFQLSNTCGYDSIFHLCSHSYEDNDSFKSYVDKNLQANGLFFTSISGYCVQAVDMFEVYGNRALILENYSISSDGILNCFCNVTTLFNNLMKNQGSCSRDIICNNQDCNHKRTENCRSLMVQVSEATEINKKCNGNIIEQCIVSAFKTEKLLCRKCRKQTAFTTVNLGSFLAIDIDDVFKDCEISTDNIPIYLNIQETKLRLSGFVVYDPKMAHYFSYCYHDSKKMYEIKDDMETNSKFCKSVPKSLKLSLLLYVRY